MMKSDNLKDYLKFLSIHRNQCELAVKKVEQELTTIMAKTQIKNLKMEFNESLTNIQFGYEFEDSFLDIIDRLNEKNNDINVDIETIRFVPFCIIDLETGTLSVVENKECKMFLQTLFVESSNFIDRLIEERKKLALKENTQNKFIQFFTRVGYKRAVFDEEIKAQKEFNNTILCIKNYFSERIYNGSIKICKEEFEAIFGIKIIIKGDKMEL